MSSQPVYLDVTTTVALCDPETVNKATKADRRKDKALASHFMLQVQEHRKTGEPDVYYLALPTEAECMAWMKLIDRYLSKLTAEGASLS